MHNIALEKRENVVGCACGGSPWEKTASTAIDYHENTGMEGLNIEFWGSAAAEIMETELRNTGLGAF
jgi:hypothetical protein